MSNKIYIYIQEYNIMTQHNDSVGAWIWTFQTQSSPFHRLTHVLYINLNKMGWLPINGDALGRGEVSFRLIMHHEHHKSDHNVLFTGFEFSMGNNYLKF